MPNKIIIFPKDFSIDSQLPPYVNFVLLGRAPLSTTLAT